MGYLLDTYRSFDRKIFSKNVSKDVDPGQMESVQRERRKKKKKWTDIDMFSTVSRTTPRPPWNNLLGRWKRGEAVRRGGIILDWRFYLKSARITRWMDAERGRESSGRRRFNTMSTARSTTTTTSFRSGLDRPGGWLSCTSLVRVSMEIGGGKVMSQAARTFISGCTGWISEFVVAPRPLARAGVGKREEVGRGGGVHSPLDGELIHVWNSSDLWPPTSASLSPSLSPSNAFLFPVWF